MEIWLWIVAISAAAGVIFFLRIISLAFWESQIERDNPWAGALNVWRVKIESIPKEVTSYHIGLAADTITSAISNDIITISFLLLCGLVVSAINALQIIMFLGAYLLIKTSMIILQFVFEDYLWHIVNPCQDDYGLHTFTEKKYPAMKGFLWIVPWEYIIFIGISGIIVAFAGILIAVATKELFSVFGAIIIGWLVIAVVLLILTVITTIKAPALHKMASQIKLKYKTKAQFIK